MLDTPLRFKARGNRRSSASARKQRQVTFTKATFVAPTGLSSLDVAEGKHNSHGDSDASRSGSSTVSSATDERIAAIAAAQLVPLQQELFAQTQQFTAMMTQMQLQNQLLTEAKDAERLKAEAAQLQARAAQDRAHHAAEQAQIASNAAARSAAMEAERLQVEAALKLQQQQAELNRQEVQEALEVTERLRQAAHTPGQAPRRTVPEPGGGTRVRGGADRFARRMEVIEKVLPLDMNPTERAKVLEAYKLSLEVDSSSPAPDVARAALGGGHPFEALSLSSTSSPSALDSLLRTSGMMPDTETDASGRIGNQVASMLRDKVDKNKSTYPRYKTGTYAEFFCKIGRRKLLSQDLHLYLRWKALGKNHIGAMIGILNA